MKINIQRGDTKQSFNIDRVTTLLEALYTIKKSQDSSLTFDAGCKSGVCGCCSVRVNGKEELACQIEPKDNDLIEPLKYYPIKKDLLVDKSSAVELLKREGAYINSYNDITLNSQDEHLTQIQSDCILCNSCYSACPVIESIISFGSLTLMSLLYLNARLSANGPKKLLFTSITGHAE